MAGELCGPGCGYCGACDGQYDDRNLGIDDQDVDEPEGDDVDIPVALLNVCIAQAATFGMSAPRETVEASDLGWKPGEWPVTFERGAQLFTRVRFERSDDDEVICADYMSAGNGATLRVWND